MSPALQHQHPGLGQQQQGDRRRRAQRERGGAQHRRHQDRHGEQRRVVDAPGLQELQAGEHQQVDADAGDPLRIEGDARPPRPRQQPHRQRGGQVGHAHAHQPAGHRRRAGNAGADQQQQQRQRRRRRARWRSPARGARKRNPANRRSAGPVAAKSAATVSCRRCGGARRCSTGARWRPARHRAAAGAPSRPGSAPCPAAAPACRAALALDVARARAAPQHVGDHDHGEDQQVLHAARPSTTSSTKREPT